MASTPEVLTSPVLSSLRKAHPTLSLPVLVPNSRGLSSLLSFQSSHSTTHASEPPLTDEIAVFVSASESFSKANLNMSISASLDALVPVFETAKQHGLRVRAYVSVVLGCPFEGEIEARKPAEVAKKLLEMGAYEVSLGDTVGVGVPSGWEKLLEECVRQGVAVDKLAVRAFPFPFELSSFTSFAPLTDEPSTVQAHCHDTYGTAVANVLHCVSVRPLPSPPLTTGNRVQALPSPRTASSPHRRLDQRSLVSTVY